MANVDDANDNQLTTGKEAVDLTPERCGYRGPLTKGKRCVSVPGNYEHEWHEYDLDADMVWTLLEKDRAAKLPVGDSLHDWRGLMEDVVRETGGLEDYGLSDMLPAIHQFVARARAIGVVEDSDRWRGKLIVAEKDRDEAQSDNRKNPRPLAGWPDRFAIRGQLDEAGRWSVAITDESLEEAWPLTHESWKEGSRTRPKRCKKLVACTREEEHPDECYYDRAADSVWRLHGQGAILWRSKKLSDHTIPREAFSREPDTEQKPVIKSNRGGTFGPMEERQEAVPLEPSERSTHTPGSVTFTYLSKAEADEKLFRLEERMDNLVELVGYMFQALPDNVKRELPTAAIKKAAALGEEAQ